MDSKTEIKAGDFEWVLTSEYNINLANDASDWTMTFCENIQYTPEEGKEPNWFHRKMQELCFGVKWKNRGE